MKDNQQSIARQIVEVNQPLPGLDSKADRKRRHDRMNAQLSLPGKALLLGTGTLALLGLGAEMRHQDDVQAKQPVEFVSHEAPRQVDPSQISTVEVTPATTIVTVGEGQGPYQVVTGAVEQGIVAPEDAPAAINDVQNQYNHMPDGQAHPNDTVSVQVSPKH
jgi:hypothetical protein